MFWCSAYTVSINETPITVLENILLFIIYIIKTAEFPIALTQMQQETKMALNQIFIL